MTSSSNTPDDIGKYVVGFSGARDQVSVQNMLFQLDHYQLQEITEQKKENREYITTLAISSLIALSLVLFFALVVRPYLRWLSYDPERKKNQSLVEEFQADLEIGNAQQVQVKEDVPFDKLSTKDQVLFMARSEPQRTCEALRSMLNPHAS